jgi:hypothetical protein
LKKSYSSTKNKKPKEEEIIKEEDNDFLKEFAFVNNAKKVSYLYKEDGDNCENELMKFEEDERKFTQLF